MFETKSRCPSEKPTGPTPGRSVTPSLARTPALSRQRLAPLVPALPGPTTALSHGVEELSDERRRYFESARSHAPDATGMPGAVRAKMEAAFGTDFSGVRVHTGSTRAVELRALAYTQGNEIHVAPGQWAPETSWGQALLGHELAHVVQQREGRATATAHYKGVALNDDPALEAEADAMGARAARGDAAQQRTILGRSPDRGGTSTVLRLDWKDVVDAVQWTSPLTVGQKHELTHVVQQTSGAPGLATSSARVQRSPAKGKPPKPPTTMSRAPILGGSPSTKDVVVLYHYGELERSREADFKTKGKTPLYSTRGYPRLTDCDIATNPFEVAAATARPAEAKIRYKYELRIARDYFKENFENTGSRGAWSEFASKHPIPIKYFRLVAEIAPPSMLEARTASGVIPAKTPPPPKPSGGGPAGSTSPAPGTTPTTGTAPAKGGTTASRGAIGGAFQLLQAIQFSNLQGHELSKFEKRLRELQPKIDGYLAQNYSVELILIVEQPKTPDVLCAAGAFCDQSQLIYFHSLYINRVESMEPVLAPPKPSSHATIGPPGGRDGFIPYTSQGGSILDESEIPYLSTRDSEHRCVYGKHTLYPPPRISFRPASRPAALEGYGDLFDAQPVKPKPQLDPEVKKAMALAPTRVYSISGNINQFKTAFEIANKLKSNPWFIFEKDNLVGGVVGSRTRVVYWCDLDKPRAEELAAILRAEGITSAETEHSSGGDDVPGHVQINWGRDAEK